MLYWLTQHLTTRISGFNVFSYLTFRAILATSSSLVISLIVGPAMIDKLSRYQIGQVVRDDGPKTHLPKAGTPTMGGTLILVTTLVSTMLWAEPGNRLGVPGDDDLPRCVEVGASQDLALRRRLAHRGELGRVEAHDGAHCAGCRRSGRARHRLC